MGLRTPAPGDPPAPTTPYLVPDPDNPGQSIPNPERNTARCPRASHRRASTGLGNILKWDGLTWRCSRGRPNHGGHVVDPGDEQWGPPAMKAGGRVLQGDLLGIRLGEHEPAVREVAATLAGEGREPNVNAAVRLLVGEALQARTLAERRRGQGGAHR